MKPGPRIDRETFERNYAAMSGTTVAALRAWGRYAERCDCGAPECSGWQMGHPWEEAIIEDRLRAAGLWS